MRSAYSSSTAENTGIRTCNLAVMEVAGIEDTIAGVWALYRNENLDGYLKECGKRLAGTVEVLILKYKYVSLSLFSIFSIYQNTGVYIYIFHA